MLVIVHSYYSKLPVVLCDKNLRICFCLQQILENLQLYKATAKVIDRRAETSANVLQHLVKVKTDGQLYKLVRLVAEGQTVAFVLNVLCQVVCLVDKQLKFLQWKTAVTL